MKASVTIPGLGHLHLIEVYEYFDGPRLFSCTSQSGMILLVIWVDVSDESDTWYYIPISRKRLDLVRCGRFGLREAVSSPEEGWFWEVTEYFSEESPLVRTRQGLEIPPDHLPSLEARLAAEGPLIIDHDLRELSHGRPLLDVALGEGDLPLIDVDNFREFLQNLQSLVRSFFPSTHSSGLQVAASFRSSFGLRLFANVSNDVKVTEALERVVNLAGASQVKTIRDHLRTLKRRQVRAYRSFLVSVAKLEVPVKLWSRTTTEEVTSVSMHPGEAWNSIAVVDSFLYSSTNSTAAQTVPNSRDTLPTPDDGPVLETPNLLYDELLVAEPVGEPVRSRLEVPKPHVVVGILRMVDTLEGRFILEMEGKSRRVTGTLEFNMTGHSIVLNRPVKVMLKDTPTGTVLTQIVEL